MHRIKEFKNIYYPNELYINRTVVGLMNVMPLEEIDSIVVGRVYLSRTSRTPFLVTGKSKHGQACMTTMIHYTNLRPTGDAFTGTAWTVESGHFKRTFGYGAYSNPVVFLDIDGVIYDPRYSETLTRSVKILNEFIAKTQAEIVLSSSWRIGERRLTIGQFLVSLGVNAVLHKDYATKSLSGFRGDEVGEWLSRHPEITEYVIIDDEIDFHETQLDRLIHTDGVEGLGRRDEQRLNALFGLRSQDHYLRPFKPLGVNRGMGTYYEEVYLKGLLESGDS